MSYSEQMLQHLASGKMKEARRDFHLAMSHDSDDLLFNLAQRLYENGFLDYAKKLYGGLLKKYPEEDELRTALAEIAIDNDDNDEALNYLADVSPDSDSYLQSLLVAADLYQTEGEMEVTGQKLREAYRIAPDEPAVIFALAEYYYLIGQFDKAIPYYFTLIKTGNRTFDKVDIAGRLGMAYAQSGQYKTALGYLKQVEPQYQTSNVRFQTGLTQLALKQYDAAKDTLSQLIEDDHSYTSSYSALARVYAAQNDYETALKTVQEGLGVDEYNEHLYAQGADMASHLGDTKTMAKYLTKAHRLAPDNLSITLSLSNFYIDQKQHLDNINLLAPLIKDQAVDPQVYWNLGRSYQATDQLKMAKQYFEAAKPAYSKDQTFLQELADLYQETGDVESLGAVLKKYVTLFPADSAMAQRLDEWQDLHDQQQ